MSAYDSVYRGFEIKWKCAGIFEIVGITGCYGSTQWAKWAIDRELDKETL